MSDRPYAQIFIYDCPEEQRADLLDALSPTFGPMGDINWGIAPVQFVVDETPCGVIEEDAPGWAKAAPGATWVAWEDPKFEWLGTAAYCLGGKVVVFTCDAEGKPVATLDAARAAGVSGEALDKLFPGHEVVEGFEKLANSPEPAQGKEDNKVVYTVALEYQVDATNPQDAVAQMMAWLENAALGDLVYAVSGPDGVTPVDAGTEL
jgi:hypothetical protein